MRLGEFFAKVKKNLPDLIATGLFAAGSIFMSAENLIVNVSYG